MFSLQDLLGQEQGTQAVDQISQNVGAEPSLVNSAIQMALPALINGLANNGATPEGAPPRLREPRPDPEERGGSAATVLTCLSTLRGTVRSMP